MATELATAYISIVAETSGIPAQIRAALGQAGTEADRQGRTIGQRFSSGFGSTMKGMLGAVGITAGIATVGAAMKSAISAIDDVLAANGEADSGKSAERREDEEPSEDKGADAPDDPVEVKSSAAAEYDPRTALEVIQFLSLEGA